MTTKLFFCISSKKNPDTFRASERYRDAKKNMYDQLANIALARIIDSCSRSVFLFGGT